MSTWHKIMNGSVVDTVTAEKGPQDIAVGLDGNPVWRVHAPVAASSYDPLTHHRPVKQPIDDGIQPTQVVDVWVAPVAKTAQELADDLEARVTKFAADSQFYGIIGLLVKQNFHLTNRVIALEGGVQYPVSVAGAQAWIDDTDALTGLPDAKLRKLIELFS